MRRSRAADYLKIVRINDFSDRGATYRDVPRNRPPAGYRRRTRREQITWALAIVLLFGGLVISAVANRPVGLAISIVGAVTAGVDHCKMREPVAGLRSGDDWIRFLTFQSRLYDYSRPTCC